MYVHIDDTHADDVNVTVRLSKRLLGDIAVNPGDPLQVYGVSVFGRLGSGTCYWDCWYVNGKKKCQCIQF